MIEIVFVCHGNICRSPMAEFIFRDLCEKKGTLGKFRISSRATSTEEIGNGVHYGTKRILNRLGISCDGKYAQRITKEEMLSADYIIVMDKYNLRNLNILAEHYGEMHKKAVQNKTFTLLSFTNRGGEVADPWYTGDFEQTYIDVKEGCDALYKFLNK